MQAALKILKPQLVETEVKAVGKVAIGMSDLLITTMTSISKTTDALTESGADGYGASRVARALLGEKQGSLGCSTQGFQVVPLLHTYA
jgi:hypothetical protein